MSLTDDWKKRELNIGVYYNKLIDGSIIIDVYHWDDEFARYDWLFNPYEISEIISRVPKYNELRRLKNKLSEQIKLKDEWADKEFFSLQREKEHLLKIKHLCNFLKACVPYINENIETQMSVGHYPELEYDLLIRIKEVLK